ncbi:hypothetical protein GCM10023203_58710 [Actinomycetospora straminea]|uniref:Uncharacterized protein n=1 Tax=Actinomycetospora straminea TaxID=663607 RepID=A0ABP9FAL5_9PSEU
MVGAAVAHDVDAAGGQGGAVAGEDRGQRGVGHEVQDGDGEQCRREVRVEEVPHARGAEHAVGVAHVGAGDADGRQPVDHLVRVRHRHRLEVHVGHARVGAVGQRDLVDVADGRHPGAEVEELGDPRGQAPLDGAAQEIAVGPADVGHVRVLGEDLRGLLAVDSGCGRPTSWPW